MDELDELRLKIAEALNIDTETRTGHKWIVDKDGDVELFEEEEHHFGPKCERCGFWYCQYCQYGEPLDADELKCTPVYPNWPRDIAAAWELVEDVSSNKWFASIDRDHTRWLCFFGSNISSEDEYYQGEGETAPEAICRAWLAWKEVIEIMQR